MVRALVAEFIGTFALIFIGAGAIITNEFTNGGVGLVGIALAHAVVLSIAVSATGHVSGGHINPAVTIGLWAAGKIDAARGAMYIVAQLLGGAAGGFLLAGVMPAAAADKANLGTPMLATGISFGQGIAIEAVLTFFLMFAIMGTAVDPKGPKSLSGFGIGMVLLFDILAAGPLTGASMNPARTFGPALAGGIWADHLVYWIGPIAGALVASLVYSRVLMKEE